MSKRKRKPRAKYWVLSQPIGAFKVYFYEWTGIGPRSTRDLDKAARFPTKRAAMSSAGFYHALSLYSPKPEAIR